jgi:maleamate amidohydrolase
VAVVADCVYDRSELTQKTSLFDMHLKYATVMELTEACAFIRNARL